MIPFKQFYESADPYLQHLKSQPQRFTNGDLTDAGLEAIDYQTAIDICDDYNGGDLRELSYLTIQQLPPNMPEHITGALLLGFLPLKSLKHMPKIIDGDLIGTYIEVDSLEGAPEHIGGDTVYIGMRQKTEWQAYIDKKKYKETATQDIDPDLGFGDLLDVL